MKKYHQVIDGAWEPLPQGWRWTHACCDCGMNHWIELRVHEGEGQIRFTYLPRISSQYRKKHRAKLTHHAKGK